MSEKKLYLVTGEWMKWAFEHGAQYAVTADCPPNFPQELPPNGKWLTRGQVEQFWKDSLLECIQGYDWEPNWFELGKRLDMLFSPEEME